MSLRVRSSGRPNGILRFRATTHCLRALVDKGWIKASNFRRSENKWAYAYLLTPSGVSAKTQLTRDFSTRNEQEFEQLQAAITMLRNKILQEQAATQALLLGEATLIESHPCSDNPERVNG